MIGGRRDMLVNELQVTPRLCHVFSCCFSAVVTTTTETNNKFVPLKALSQRRGCKLRFSEILKVNVFSGPLLERNYIQGSIAI